MQEDKIIKKPETENNLDFDCELEMRKIDEMIINGMTENQRIKFLYKSSYNKYIFYLNDGNTPSRYIFEKIYNAGATLFYAAINIKIKHKDSIEIAGKKMTVKDLEIVLKDIAFEAAKFDFPQEIFDNVNNIIKKYKLDPSVLLVTNENNIFNAIKNLKF